MHYEEIEDKDEMWKFRESKKFYCVVHMSFENADDSYLRKEPPVWWLREERMPEFSEDGNWLGTQEYTRDGILEEYLFNDKTDAKIFMNEQMLSEEKSKRDKAIKEIEYLKHVIEELKKDKQAEESKE